MTLNRRMTLNNLSMVSKNLYKRLKMTENIENNAEENVDTWQLCGKTLHSRLLLGTGGMTSIDIMEKSLVASGAEVATVALRRHAKNWS